MESLWQPEGSYEIGSVRPSVGLYRRFLEALSLVFSEFGMVLEIHSKLGVTELDFLGKIFWLKNLGKWTKNWPRTGFFWIYWQIWSLIFTELVLLSKLILLAVFLQKSHVWENFCFRHMSQNILSQTDCRMF